MAKFEHQIEFAIDGNVQGLIDRMDLEGWRAVAVFPAGITRSKTTVIFERRSCKTSTGYPFQTTPAMWFSAIASEWKIKTP
jgi:hypothetical protein